MADKLPWFKFFPFDWETDEDVQLMDFFERGVFLTLLCRNWIEGSIPKDPSKAIALLKQSYSGDTAKLKQAYDKIIKLFLEHPENPDRLIHWKLEEQRQELEKLRETRRKAGSKGAKQRYSKAKAKLKQSYSEPEPEPEPDIKIKNINKKENNHPESIDQIIQYFKDKGMDTTQAEIQASAFHEYYDPEQTGRYRDKSGKLISSWKRNAATWFANYQNKPSNGHNRQIDAKTGREKISL